MCIFESHTYTLANRTLMASGCTTPLHKQVPYLSMDHRQLYMRVYYLYTRCVGLNTAVALWTDAGVGGGET